MSAPFSVTGSRGRHLATLALVVGAFAAYNLNGRLIGEGDTFPARFIPFAIWNHGTVFLDPIRDLVAMGHQEPYWIQPALGGRSASLYPIVLPVMVSPLYAPLAVGLRTTGVGREGVVVAAELMEKLLASAIAAATAGLVLFALRRRVEERLALGLAALLAIGTNMWAISSQSFWQHGLGASLFASLLVAFTRPPTVFRVAVAGVLAGLALCNRPPDGPMVAALGIHAVIWSGRRWPALLAGLVPLGLTVAYNLEAFGNPLGGYGRLAMGGDVFSRDPWTGAAGLLASPGKGLLVFSPFFAFLVLLPRHLRASPWRGLDGLIVAGFAGELALYGSTFWAGGYSFGYRFLTDFTPCLIWLLAPVVAALRRVALAMFGIAATFSVAVQYVGAFHYSGISQPPLFEADSLSESSAIWSWAQCPILVEARQPIAAPALAQALWRALRAALSPAGSAHDLDLRTNASASANKASSGPARSWRRSFSERMSGAGPRPGAHLASTPPRDAGSDAAILSSSPSKSRARRTSSPTSSALSARVAAVRASAAAVSARAASVRASASAASPRAAAASVRAASTRASASATLRWRASISACCCDVSRCKNSRSRWSVSSSSARRRERLRSAP